MITLNARSLDLLAPLVLKEEEFKALLCCETFYDEYKPFVFPAFNIRAGKPRELTAVDIKTALLNIKRRQEKVRLFREWFWLIINVFYEDLSIEGRFDEELFSDDPETDDQIFSTVYDLCDKLYWKLEERLGRREDIERYMIKFSEPVGWGKCKNIDDTEEQVLEAVIEDIAGRVTAFEYNRDHPGREHVFADSAKLHIISSYDEDENSLDEASDEAVILYKKFVRDLYRKGEPAAISALAWGHYEGNRIYEQSWLLAEKYMLELFEKNGDPYAANALGYIYFYGRLNGGIGEYEKAFKYFSYGALAGLDESVYEISDMLLRGLGTKKNVDMGLGLLLDGYKDSMESFCAGQHTNKLADYALRMGNACRENLIYGMGVRDAYKFYLEAKYAIRERRSESNYYGDDVVERHIDNEIAHILDSFSLDIKKDTLKCDFPIYINQLFDDRYPLKVTIKNDKNFKKGSLKVERFRPLEALAETIFTDNDELIEIMGASKILVAIPELSYVEMTSELTFELEDITVIKKPDNEESFFSDGFRRSETTNALEFYANGELIAAIDTRWYVLKVDKSDYKLL